MLINLYSRDLLGSDGKLDVEEYKAMIRNGSTKPTSSSTTLKDMFSKKPFEFWDLNKDDIISYKSFTDSDKNKQLVKYIGEDQ